MSAFVNALCTPLLIFHTIMDTSLLGGNVNSSTAHFPAGPYGGRQRVEKRGDGLYYILVIFFF